MTMSVACFNLLSLCMSPTFNSSVQRDDKVKIRQCSSCMIVFGIVQAVATGALYLAYPTVVGELEWKFNISFFAAICIIALSNIFVILINIGTYVNSGNNDIPRCCDLHDDNYYCGNNCDCGLAENACCTNCGCCCQLYRYFATGLCFCLQDVVLCCFLIRKVRQCVENAGASNPRGGNNDNNNLAANLLGAPQVQPKQ